MPAVVLNAQDDGELAGDEGVLIDGLHNVLRQHTGESRCVCVCVCVYVCVCVCVCVCVK